MHNKKTLLAIVLLTAFAAALSGETPKSSGEKKIYKLYQKSLGGDTLMAAGKYKEAYSLYSETFEAVTELLDSDYEVSGFELDIGASELLTVRALQLDYSELENSGKSSMRADRFAELLEELVMQTQFASVGNPDYDDGQIADEAIRVIKELNPPVPDAQAASAQARLSLALAKLDGAIKREPSLANKAINGTTGAAALKKGQANLLTFANQSGKTKGQTAVPMGAQIALDLGMEQLEKIEADLNKDGFLADEDFLHWILDPSVKLNQLGGTVKKAYEQEGTAMPANALKALSDKASALKALALKKAPGFSFPQGLSTDPDIESRVSAQLKRNLLGLKVLAFGMEGSAWGINKNSLGLPESRYRYGYVLYQIAGEQFPRCSRFSYRENYDGKNYVKADGASAYSATRWQAAK